MSHLVQHSDNWQQLYWINNITVLTSNPRKFVGTHSQNFQFLSGILFTLLSEVFLDVGNTSVWFWWRNQTFGLAGDKTCHDVQRPVPSPLWRMRLWHQVLCATTILSGLICLCIWSERKRLTLPPSPQQPFWKKTVISHGIINSCLFVFQTNFPKLWFFPYWVL